MAMESSRVHKGRSLTTLSLNAFAIRTPTVLPPSLSLLGSLPRSPPSWMRYQQAGSNPDTGIRHKGQTNTSSALVEIPQKNEMPMPASRGHSQSLGVVLGYAPSIDLKCGRKIH